MKFTIPEIDEAKGGTMEVEGELVAMLSASIIRCKSYLVAKMTPTPS